MDKKLIIGADPAGYKLKESVKAHLIEQGYDITDVGTLSPEEPVEYHKVGFAVGKAISEKKFERGLLFCGSGMGVHIVAGKFPASTAPYARIRPPTAAARSTTATFLPWADSSSPSAMPI